MSQRPEGDPGQRHWTPVLLALGLAAVVAVVGTMVSLAHRQPTPVPPGSVQPLASTPATPVGFVARIPPSDRPLIWIHTLESDAQTLRLRALDWAGHEVGAVELPCPQPCYADASPDGQRFEVIQQPAEGQLIPAVLYNAGGGRIGIIGEQALWADDSRHLCLAHNQPSTAAGPVSPDLEIVDSSGGPPRVVASLPAAIGTPAPGGSGWQVIACSMAADRAVLVAYGLDAGQGIRVIQISSGRTLLPHDGTPAVVPCQCLWFQVVGLRGDAAIETPAGAGGRWLDLTSGRLTPLPAWIDPSVPGFSSTGRLAVTTRGLVDVATGRLVWKAPPTANLSLISVRPGSDDVLLSLSSIGPTRDAIIRGDGVEIDLPASVAW